MSAGTSGRPGKRLALCGTVALTAVVLAGCGGSTQPSANGKPAINGKLNTPRVALAIEHSILSERHIKARVSCPPNVPQEKGLSFTCVATTYTKKGHHPIHTMFTVFQTDSAGHVYYQSPK